MKKTQVVIFILMTLLMLSLSSIPTVFADLPLGYSTVEIECDSECDTWYFWDTNSDSVAILLFGGWNNTLGPKIKTVTASKQVKSDFIGELLAYGLDAITIVGNYSYKYNDNDWLTAAAEWLRDDQEYTNVYLFGYSAGGVAVGYEIQKPGAGELYDAAVMAAAPVDHYGQNPITIQMYATAQRSENTTVRTSFIVNQYDAHNCCAEMKLYYDNMNPDVDKEWHQWGIGLDEHDVFNANCLVCGKNLSEAVYDWFTGPVLIPVDIEIDAVAQNDPWARYHGLTVDDPMSLRFWEENPSPVIDVTTGTLDYETTLYLTEGPHNIEYAVSAWVGYWEVTITVEGYVIAEQNSDVHNHVVAEIYVPVADYLVGIGARNLYYDDLYGLPIGVDGEFVGYTCDYFPLLVGFHTIEVPSYIYDYFGYTIEFQYWEWNDRTFDTVELEIFVEPEDYKDAIAVYLME